MNGGGVYINYGSAVTMPEIFLKAVTVVRNLGYELTDITTANFDFIQQYRPLTNVVRRPTADGAGRGYAITGHHELTLPLLAAQIICGDITYIYEISNEQRSLLLYSHCPVTFVPVFATSALFRGQFRAFDAKGNPVTMDQIIKAIGETDVVFLGEQHDDGVGHAVQAEIFKRTVEQYGAKRRVALSLEMFERDNQIVVNEYFNGQITEAHFMSSSRPWPNYKTDYRPLVELAKEKRLSVIAANAPRRYINMVSRNGRDALNSLTKPAKEWIAPLPYGEPSATMPTKFKALMGPSPEAQMGIDKILASQSLWDATMANSVAKYLK